MGACASTEPDANGKSRIDVDGSRCISCGACFDTCEHGARAYIDDTEDFFRDLSNGKRISLLIAPAFLANYPEDYAKVLGGLKEMGARHMINVSFGADITTWGYLKYITEKDFKGGISQPCPAVVGYIERYIPELIPKLFPVQSPLMCAAIYARHEMGIMDGLAFISPCIQKKMEIDDPNNKGLVQYNVTFAHLMAYMREYNLFGKPYNDELEYGLGSVYPMRGGLKENVSWFMGEEAFVREIGGEKRMYSFLENNKENIKEGKTPFLFIDALNCENGCLCGTGTEEGLYKTDKALYNLCSIRASSMKEERNSAWAKSLTPEERLRNLNEQFSHLKIEDYIREYTDRSNECRMEMPDDKELEGIFLDMNKEDEKSRHINCSCCGYATCRDMAVAIFNGFNHRDNCIHYLKDLVAEKAHLTDMATGLPNSAGFDAHVEVLENSGLLKNFDACHLNIRNFGLINEHYGKEEADEVILRYATRLKSMLTGDEFIARLLADNFICLVRKEHIWEFLNAIKGLYFNMDHGGKEENIFIQAVAGCLDLDGTYRDGESIKALCANALRTAKTGNSHYQYATLDMWEKILKKKHVLETFPRALSNGEFKAYYQPKVDTVNNTLVGAEALVRWIKGNKVIPPSEFIPVLEEDGGICELDLYIFTAVCRDIRGWMDNGMDPVRISANFSRRDLSEPGFAKRLKDIMESYDIPKEYIEIEITETATEEDNGLLSRFLKDMHNAGIAMALDDFGTGYSSLNLLRDFSADVLKLDKSFIDGHTNTRRDNIVLDHIAQMANELDMSVITEGVEQWEQVEFLKKLNVNLVQGYLFDKPMPEEDFEKRLKEKVYQKGDPEKKIEKNA